jgi:hypothetical protein
VRHEKLGKFHADSAFKMRAPESGVRSPIGSATWLKRKGKERAQNWPRK